MPIFNAVMVDMGCIYSRPNVMEDSYVYDTEMPLASTQKSSHSIISKVYFQKFVKRDNGQDAAYTEILE